jgi:hypothetical protein
MERVPYPTPPNEDMTHDNLFSNGASRTRMLNGFCAPANQYEASTYSIRISVSQYGHVLTQWRRIIQLLCSMLL